MVDLSYDSYLNSSKKTKSKPNKLSYDSYLSSTQPKEPSKISKGLSGVGNFGKELVKEGVGATLVRPADRATEAITRTLFPNSLASKGYEAMADEGQSRKFAGIEVKQTKALGQGGLKQIAGEGLETASWLYGGEGLKAGAKAVKAVKGATKLEKLASKKTFAELAVKQIPELAKLGFVGSASATLGNQLQKTAGTDDKIDWNQAVKDITIGTLATPVVGLALTKLFGTKASKILEARQALKDTEIASNKARIGDMKPGTPFDNIKPNLEDNSFANLPGEKPNITVAPGAKWETPKVTPKNPLETRATRATTQGDFVANEVAFLNRTKQPITSTTMKQIDTAWTKMHPAPVQEKVSKVTSKVEQPIVSKVEQPINQPKVEVPVTPEQTQRTSNFEEVFAKQDSTMPPEFKGGNLKTRAENFDKKFAEDPAHMERVAMGIERDPLIPQEDALGAMRKLAQDNNDIKLIDRLSDSNVGSQAGSNFNGLKLAGENDVSKIWHDLKMSIKERLPNTFKKSEKETKEAVGKLKKYFKENNIPEKEFNNLMDEFVCK